MLGIAGEGLALTGPEVDAMDAEQLKAIAPDCNIYARASPENKIRIVRALQVRVFDCACVCLACDWRIITFGFGLSRVRFALVTNQPPRLSTARRTPSRAASSV
jgi:hypothetical protein